MIIPSSENLNLYGLDIYFNEIIRLYDQKKMPNKLLFSGKKGIGKSTLAYHIVNYIFSQNEENKYDNKKFKINNDNKSFKLINNKSHPNFFLIDLHNDKKNIDVDQIRQMIIYTNKSSFNNLPRFILIDNVETLNKNSINALLKIVEEPNENIFFILIQNSEKKLLPTLQSRCLSFKINLSFDKCVDITNLLLKKNILEDISPELINFYYTPGEFIQLFKFADEKKIDLNTYSIKSFLKLLIDNSYYKKDKLAKNLIISFMQLFFLNEFKITQNKYALIKVYKYFLNKIDNMERFNLDEESFFLEFKSKLLYE